MEIRLFLLKNFFEDIIRMWECLLNEFERLRFFVFVFEMNFWPIKKLKIDLQ